MTHLLMTRATLTQSVCRANASSTLKNEFAPNSLLNSSAPCRQTKNERSLDIAVVVKNSFRGLVSIHAWVVTVRTPQKHRARKREKGDPP
jgi:hypothetical protein